MAREDFYHVPHAPRPNVIVPAASAVVLKGNGVLLQRRADSGWWALPGGVIEPGETIAQTCMREVMEETGIKVSIDRLVGIYSDPQHVIRYDDGEIRQQFSVCFLCSVVGGALAVSGESTEVAWIDLDRLAHLPLHPAQLERIRDATHDQNPVVK